MNRMLVGVLAGVSLAAASLAPAAAQYAPQGSYQQSCTNVHVRAGQLIAHCTNPQGIRVRSSIALGSCRGGDIANSNGQLTCHGGGFGRRGGGMMMGRAPNGSYRQSCQNVQMRGGLLRATCPDANGHMIQTSLDTRGCRGTDVANRNGQLVCQ